MKGFTLVELMVAIFIASISLALVSGTIYFGVQIANKTMLESSITYKIMKIKDFIIEKQITDANQFSFSDDKIYYADNLLFDEIEIKDISFYSQDDFVYSSITYYASSNNSRNITFVVCESF